MRIIIILLCTLIFLDCKPKSHSANSNNTQSLPNQSGRDSWQKPELVINALGDLKNKTVVDIGAGTGYFTFRLAFLAEKVIAVDIDPNMIDLIDFMKVNLPQKIQKKIETRLVAPDDPGLQGEEADIAVIINTIAYIENPISYLGKLSNHLTPSGKIAIIDFKKKYLTIDAPPIEERIAPEKIVSILSEAGYQNIKVDEETIDFQYIITAFK